MNAPLTAAAPRLADKVAFLSSPAAFGGAGPVRAVETHMSWVFIAGERVLKLKKPVRYAFLDFATLPARALNCREEVRLNRRLAPDVYLGVAALLQRIDGSLALGALDPCRGQHDGGEVPAHAAVVDWLVCMRRLPDDLMLDEAIRHGRVGPAAIDTLADLLAGFYRQAPRVQLDGAHYVQRLAQEQAINREVLLRPPFGDAALAATLARLDAALERLRAPLAARADAGCLREGHGDLRPEHVCLTDPPVVIDCLEFNRALREVDPFEDLAYLEVECRLLGADWIGSRLTERVAAQLVLPAPAALRTLYAAYRALVRARLSAAHLLEPQPRTPERWLPRARQYAALARAALDALEAEPLHAAAH